MRLNAEGTAHALATRGTMAAALQQAFRSDSMSKPIHAGHAAEAVRWPHWPPGAA